MSRKASRLGYWIGGALGAVLVFAAGAAAAQDYYDNSESVIVHPPYDQIMRRPSPDRHGGDPLFNLDEEVSLSRPVSYGDLDLSRFGDRQELAYRVRRTAEDICNTLDHYKPGAISMTDRSECVGKAVRNAMADVGPMRDYRG